MLMKRSFMRFLLLISMLLLLSGQRSSAWIPKRSRQTEIEVSFWNPAEERAAQQQKH